MNWDLVFWNGADKRVLTLGCHVKVVRQPSRIWPEGGESKAKEISKENIDNSTNYELNNLKQKKRGEVRK